MRWLFSKKQQELQLEILAKQIAKEEAEHEFKIKTLQNAINKTVCTPDTAELANKTTVAVFVYNDLMKKRRDHEALEPIAFCGEAYTDFDVNGWYRKKDKMPICMRPQILSRIPKWSGMQKNAHAAILKGEVFLISVNKLFELDLYHDNRVQFIRQKIDIKIPYSEDVESPYTGDTVNTTVVVRTGTHLYKGKVWAYLGNPAFWWGDADPFSFARNEQSSGQINNIDFVPMPIFTPKKTWKELYYYHARN